MYQSRWALYCHLILNLIDINALWLTKNRPPLNARVDEDAV
jgi:hypothetical protein